MQKVNPENFMVPFLGKVNPNTPFTHGPYRVMQQPMCRSTTMYSIMKVYYVSH